MRIRSDDHLSFIDLKFVQSLSDEAKRLTGRDDISLGIEVKCLGFSGRNEDIWFDRDVINNFLTDIKRMEEKRIGQAKLVSLGEPSENVEFQADFYITSLAGYAAVQFSLQKFLRLDHNETFPLKVSAAFDLDPGDLITMVSDFERLFSGSDSTELVSDSTD